MPYIWETVAVIYNGEGGNYH